MSEHRSLERIDRDNPIASAAPGTEAGQEILDIAATIDIADSQQVLEYGISAQTELSDFADSVLSEVRARDTGHVGEALGDLMVQVKSMNIDRLSAPQKGIAGLFSRLNRNVRQFCPLKSAPDDAIVARLEGTGAAYPRHRAAGSDVRHEHRLPPGRKVHRQISSGSCAGPGSALIRRASRPRTT